VRPLPSLRMLEIAGRTDVRVYGGARRIDVQYDIDHARFMALFVERITKVWTR